MVLHEKMKSRTVCKFFPELWQHFNRHFEMCSKCADTVAVLI